MAIKQPLGTAPRNGDATDICPIIYLRGFLGKLGLTSLAVLTAICMMSSVLAAEHGFTTLDFPGAQSTSANGISPDGDIVGSYILCSVCGGNGQFPSGYLLNKEKYGSFSASLGTQALGINPRGDIIGSDFGQEI